MKAIKMGSMREINPVQTSYTLSNRTKKQLLVALFIFQLIVVVGAGLIGLYQLNKRQMESIRKAEVTHSR